MPGSASQTVEQRPTMLSTGRRSAIRGREAMERDVPKLAPLIVLFEDRRHKRVSREGAKIAEDRLKPERLSNNKWPGGESSPFAVLGVLTFASLLPSCGGPSSFGQLSEVGEMKSGNPIARPPDRQSPSAQTTPRQARHLSQLLDSPATRRYLPPRRRQPVPISRT